MNRHKKRRRRTGPQGIEGNVWVMPSIQAATAVGTGSRRGIPQKSPQVVGVSASCVWEAPQQSE